MCVIAFDDDVTLRIIEDTWNTEPPHRLRGDRIPAERRHRNDFIVLGILDGIVKKGSNRLNNPPSTSLIGDANLTVRGDCL
ncbi:hypothetical protein GCM10025857_03320 [Alicyclobacillus contaminans]|nr:hypothetical protein GCM10025857_03320 [Alicyclobacillus contaminans]